METICECPQNLVVSTDHMRLKQIILNLARNSSKFVEKGFVRLRAEIREDSGSVRIFVEDSGPGIPVEKRQALFAKFQSSLDNLNQGTGIGLSLCKKLVDNMGMDLWLDESYHSGIEGSPGARFVLDMNVPPEEEEILEDEETCEALSPGSSRALGESKPNGESDDEIDEDGDVDSELPDGLRVLFVDDDRILRRLFARTVKKIQPTWAINEAASGETALKLVETQDFDLIFVDQYMASVERTLLGTETVRAMRAKGVTSVLCGLSANDMEAGFKENGANAFLTKPFPTKPEALKKAIKEVLAAPHTREDISSLPV